MLADFQITITVRGKAGGKIVSCSKSLSVREWELSFGRAAMADMAIKEAVEGVRDYARKEGLE